MAWLEPLFGDPERRMFPGLPGDPPGPETLGWLALHALGLCLAVACIRWLTRRRKYAHGADWVLRAPIALSVLIGMALVPTGLTIRSRSEGRWGDLQRELTAFAADVGRYEALHGTIDSERKVQQFYDADPVRHRRRFSFTASGPEVHLVYRWWADPPRPMIVWDRGRSAGFDVRTMICDAFD